MLTRVPLALTKPFRMRTALLIGCLCLLAQTCSETPADTENAAARPAAPLSGAEAEARALDLMSLLSSDTSRAAREQNAIVNLAIDSLWAVQPAAEGYFYEVIRPGDGPPVAWGDRLRADYRGTFTDGTVFDETYKRQRPLEFYVGNMIPAWNYGLQQINVGGRIRLLAPSAAAYGADGLLLPDGDTLVPPHSVLVFEVEVLEKL